MKQKKATEEKEIRDAVAEIEGRESFDEDDAYKMPLDQLRLRANGIR